MKKEHCLIIGAGINGLSSGIKLLENGLKATIWSSSFSPNTTSDIAAAYWYPFLSAPVEKTNMWGSKTYDVLKKLSEIQDTGVAMTQTYEYFREPQPDPPWRDIVDNFERIKGEFPADYVECFSFITAIVEMPIYLKWLISRYSSLGGQYRQKTIDSFTNLPDDYDAIINCTGLASKKLLNDEKLYPVRGQIIRVKANIENMYLDQKVETLTHIVPRSGDVALGGVAQQNNWSLDVDPLDREEILRKCSLIIPDIRNAEIIDEVVGLRPGRAEVRLEKEIVDGRPLIHNYGHGGSGVTLSWGCADEVVDLVND